jgi:hypothetical protein
MKKKESLLRSSSGSMIFVLVVYRVEVNDKISSNVNSIVKTIKMLYPRNLEDKCLSHADADSLVSYEAESKGTKK